MICTTTRRSLILGALSLTACARLARSAQAAEDGVGLGSIAAEKGITFGSWVRASSLKKDPALAEIVAAECKLMTCGEVHWDIVEKTSGAEDYSICDGMQAWGAERGIKTRGHALIWWKRVPEWFDHLHSQAECEKAMRAHIRKTAEHFRGRLHSWDVVNEAIRAKDGREDGLKKCNLLEKVGPQYIEIAFQEARAADPTTPLVYNDGGLEYIGPNQEKGRVALIKMLDRMKAGGVPIDAVGMHSHLITAWKKQFDQKSYAAFLKDISDRGLKIYITELDVTDKGSPSEIVARDSDVAATYRSYLDVVLDNPATNTVLTWGLSDADSWITSGKASQTAQLKREDGLTPRPLPFDGDYKPKTCYHAIAEAFQAAATRQPG